MTDPAPPPPAPAPEAALHPVALAVNAVLSPPPTQPAGQVKPRDVLAAIVSALAKSGLALPAALVILAALGSMKGLPDTILGISVSGAIAFASTLLRLYASQPPPTGQRQGATGGTGG